MTALEALQAVLAGRYRIQRELGRGGMATVYLAHDLGDDRPVAIKVLHREVSGAVGADRFAREIAIAARLLHPQILPVLDSGSVTPADGSRVGYYVMPYVPGRSLRDRLDRDQVLPVDEAVTIARQIADALDHAHAHGVIHRDIKPENILLDEGSAKLADFGIARALDAAGERLTETGLALGTPAYMSPEQGAGTARLDGRADIYALGCVLYEMLAGEPPFTGATAQAILARHAMDQAPSLHTVRPGVSAGLARVVMRAVAKVPADRFPTARAFADALAAPDLSLSGPMRARALPRLAGIIALVAALATAIGLRVHSSARTPVKVDPALVAIAPFRMTGTSPSLGYLREGMVDLLAAKLGGTLALHPADSRTLLNTWRRVAGGRKLTEERALAAAAGLGAGRLVQGEIAGSGPRLKISASLLEVPGARVRARDSVEGPADSLTSLVEELAARLLVLAAGEPEDRVPAVVRTTAEARQAYLDGWALFRRNDNFHARKKFEEALAADSTFALAAFGATLVIFDDEFLRDAPDVQAAWQLRDRLPRRDRALLETWLGADYPEVTEPRRYAEDAKRLTRITSDNPDAWHLYGLIACGDHLAVLGDPEGCRSAYRHTLALDPTTVPRLSYAIGWAMRMGDTAAVKRGRRLYLLVDSASPRSTYMQWETATLLGNTAAARRAASSDSMVSTRADAAVEGIWWMHAFFLREGLGLRDYQLALNRSLSVAATGSQRQMLELLQIRLALARGRRDSLQASQLYLAVKEDYQLVLNALFLDGDPAAAAPAALELERRVGLVVKNGCCLERFASAEWALEHGQLATARRALADMERYRWSPEVLGQKSGPWQVWPLIVATQLAARERSSSAGERLRTLDSVLVWVDQDWGDPLLYGNLIVARLFEQRGDYAAALAAIRRTQPVASTMVTYHREEGRIAAEAGDIAGAIRAYQRYLRIRGDADPSLQPQVQRVRAELAALGRSR